MFDQLEARVFLQIDRVLFLSGGKIVDADDFVAGGQKLLAQVISDKTGTAGDCDAHPGSPSGFVREKV